MFIVFESRWKLLGFPSDYFPLNNKALLLKHPGFRFAVHIHATGVDGKKRK